MDTTFLIAIIQNIAFLLAFSMTYDYFWAGKIGKLSLKVQVVIGLLLAGVGFILISTPWILQDGIILDSRSVLLSIAGLFFGVVPTFIAMLLLSIFRFVLAGQGMWMGIATIISSGIIGILWKNFRPNWKTKNILLELLALGFITHIVMLLDVVFLPASIKLNTLISIFPIVLTVYPLATLLLGLLMIRQTENKENKVALEISEERWRAALEGAGDYLWDFDVLKNEVFISDQFKKLLGLDETRKIFTWIELEEKIHSDFVDKIRMEFWKLKYNDSQIFEVEIKVRKKNGGYVWMLDRGKVMTRDELGIVTRCIGTLTDVTQQKEIKDSLYESQIQLKNFAAHLHNVREEERVILAREIHDELGQSLVAIKMDVGMLQSKVSKNHCEECSGIIKNHLEHIIFLVDSSIGASRRIMTDLRPEVIDLLGVVEAIRQYCVIFEKRYQIKCTFETEVELIELEKQQELALFRIVQEALNNIVKHAQATEILVLIVLDDHSINLEICDNGIGFDINKSMNESSYGLIGMKERTYLFGGSLNIESDAENGTRVHINIPSVNAADNDGIIQNEG